MNSYSFELAEKNEKIFKKSKSFSLNKFMALKGALLLNKKLQKQTTQDRAKTELKLARKISYLF